jgi:hypothetical protein
MTTRYTATEIAHRAGDTDERHAFAWTYLGEGCIRTGTIDDLARDIATSEMCSEARPWKVYVPVSDGTLAEAEFGCIAGKFDGNDYALVTVTVSLDGCVLEVGAYSVDGRV